MKRTILSITIALAALLVPVTAAWADDAPTKEQLDAAKKAFVDGKAFHDLGKLPEAIEKFKESYRLSRNPVLLYNIALTLDENKQTDNALFYYRKFLADAPQSAAQRKAADDRVKTLEKEKLEADLNGKPADTTPKPDTKQPPDITTTTDTAPKIKPDAGTQKPLVKIKPAGTYGPNDFQHQIVEDAPPGKPLDISAFVPEDSGFTVTLFYRGAGDANFVAKPMKWHYKELVARIPRNKVSGSSIQYYVEAKDQSGTVIAKSGKSTSPNLINIDPSASPHFFPDLQDDGPGVSTETKTVVDTRRHDEEDPFNKDKHQDSTPKQQPEPDPGTGTPIATGDGFTDVGSHKFEQAKWAATGTAGGLLILGITFYVLAGNQASALVTDSKMCPGGGTPPCRAFDQVYDKPLQDAGQRDQTISNIGIGFGIAATAVAAYFWYQELSAKPSGEHASNKSSSNHEMTWLVAPSFSENFNGAAAVARF